MSINNEDTPLLAPKPRNIDLNLPENNDDMVTNNWTVTNMTTVKGWKSSLAKASFIYQEVLEGDRNKLNRIGTLTLILSAILTVLTAVSSVLVRIDIEGYELATQIITVVSFVITALLTILGGMLKIYKWDKNVATYTGYIAQLDGLYSIIASQLILPSSLRMDALTLIRAHNESYTNIMKQSPNINASTYRAASRKYAKFLQEA